MNTSFLKSYFLESITHFCLDSFCKNSGTTLSNVALITARISGIALHVFATHNIVVTCSALCVGTSAPATLAIGFVASLVFSANIVFVCQKIYRLYSEIVYMPTLVVENGRKWLPTKKPIIDAPIDQPHELNSYFFKSIDHFFSGTFYDNSGTNLSKFLLLVSNISTIALHIISIKNILYIGEKLCTGVPLSVELSMCFVVSCFFAANVFILAQKTARVFSDIIVDFLQETPSEI